MRREFKALSLVFALLFTLVSPPTQAYVGAPRISISDSSNGQSQRWVLTWDNADVRDSAATFLASIVARNFQDSGLIVNGAQAKVLQLLQQFVSPAGTQVLVEPDVWVSAQRYAVNDTYYPVQWDMAAPTADVYGIDLAGARSRFIGAPGAGARVAILDTGIQAHPDLPALPLTWAGSNKGWDFYDKDVDPTDPGDACSSDPSPSSSWHGTHVAGTIAAITDNGIGVAGIAPGADLVYGRVLGPCGGYLSDIADAIRWAAGLTVAGSTIPVLTPAAKVVNLSLGGSGSCDSYMQSAITAARNAGTTVVVAAGNDGSDASSFTPANCSGVITVGATGLTGKRSWYSNYGSAVEISAPGGDDGVTSVTYAHGEIISTLNTGITVPVAPSYEWYEGTSMATPHVVGVVALMLSRRPSLTPAQIETALKVSATAFPADSSANACTNTGLTCGGGILNARAAIDAVVPALANAVTVDGPTSGLVSTSSSAFTVSPNSYYTGTISVAVSGGGLNTTITKSFSNSYIPQTFTITPITTGPVTLTTTSLPVLTNGARITYSSNSAGLTPIFSSPVRISGGFTVNVSNFNSAYTYALSSNSGVVTKGTASGSTLPLTVSKLALGASATLTVTTTRTGFMPATAQVSGTALLGAALNPTLSSPVRTTDGFTLNVTNYDKNFVFTPTVSAGRVTVGKITGTTIPLTVTGLNPGQSATLTMTTTRNLYTNGLATVASSALLAGLKPTLSTPVQTANGFTVNVTNYDPNYVFTPAFDPVGGAAAVVVGAINGATMPLTITGLTPGQARTLVVTATRTGYTTPVGARASAAALLAALVPTFSVPVKTATGFTVNMTNYAAGYTFTVTTSAGTVSKGNASGNNLPLTVAGLTTPAQGAIITVTATRAGYATGSATLSGSRL